MRSSVDDDSDDSKAFIDDQKNIKELHEKFSGILDDIKEFGAKQQTITDSFGVTEVENETLDHISENNVSHEEQAILLIKEIKKTKTDLKTVQNLIASKKINDRVRAAKIIRQMDDIMQIIDGQLFRAERLLQ